MTISWVLVYRWIVFLLAAGYTLNEILSSSYASPGGPFRFLTIWALIASFYSASRMLAITEGRITRSHDVTASVTAVLNAMVVILYWRLYLEDPALVRGSGSLDIKWWREYYLHLLGPLLQWIDALFIARVFRRHTQAVTSLIGVVVAYALWVELFVKTFNDTPVGSVTSGLPYPFLNSMQLDERITYYATNAIAALLIYALFVGVGLLVRRSLPEVQVVSAARSDARPSR